MTTTIDYLRKIGSQSIDSIPSGLLIKITAQMRINPVLNSMMFFLYGKKLMNRIRLEQVRRPQNQDLMDVHDRSMDSTRAKTTEKLSLISNNTDITRTAANFDKISALKDFIPSNHNNKIELDRYIDFIAEKYRSEGVTVGFDILLRFIDYINHLQDKQQKENAIDQLIGALQDARTAYERSAHKFYSGTDYSCMPGLKDRLLDCLFPLLIPDEQQNQSEESIDDITLGLIKKTADGYTMSDDLYQLSLYCLYSEQTFALSQLNDDELIKLRKILSSTEKVKTPLIDKILTSTDTRNLSFNKEEVLALQTVIPENMQSKLVTAHTSLATIPKERPRKLLQFNAKELPDNKLQEWENYKLDLLKKGYSPKQLTVDNLLLEIDKIRVIINLERSPKEKKKLNMKLQNIQILLAHVANQELHTKRPHNDRLIAKLNDILEQTKIHLDDYLSVEKFNNRDSNDSHDMSVDFKKFQEIFSGFYTIKEEQPILSPYKDSEDDEDELVQQMITKGLEETLNPEHLQLLEVLVSRSIPEDGSLDGLVECVRSNVEAGKLPQSTENKEDLLNKFQLWKEQLIAAYQNRMNQNQYIECFYHDEELIRQIHAKLITYDVNSIYCDDNTLCLVLIMQLPLDLDFLIAHSIRNNFSMTLSKALEIRQQLSSMEHIAVFEMALYFGHQEVIDLLGAYATLSPNNLNVLFIKALTRFPIIAIRKLIELGAMLSAGGMTALHMLSQMERDPNNTREVVELLIDKGVPIDAKDRQGFTALNLFTDQKPSLFRYRCITALIDHGADLHYAPSSGKNTPMQSILNQQSIRLIEHMLEKGKQLIDDEGKTPLHQLAIIGRRKELKDDVQCVTLLVKKFGINAKSNDGLTALNYALIYLKNNKDFFSGEKIITALIEKGADINYGPNSTPLQEAVDEGHVSIVRLLLEKGAIIPDEIPGNIDDDNPDRPKPEIVSLILQALIQQGEKKYITRLMRRLDTDLTRDELSKAIDKSLGLKNKKIVTEILMYAIEQVSDKPLRTKYWLEKIQSIIKLGIIDINAEYEGKTLLMHALERQSPELILLLLENGADINHKTSENNETPLDYALKLYSTENKGQNSDLMKDMIRLLIDRGGKTNQQELKNYESPDNASVNNLPPEHILKKRRSGLDDSNMPNGQRNK